MTKKIGIIGAMDDEISVYLKSLEDTFGHSCGFPYYIPPRNPFKSVVAL